MGRNIPAMVRGRGLGGIGNQGCLVGPNDVDQFEKIGDRIALDVELDGVVVLRRQHGRQFGHVATPDVALVGARVDRNAVGARVDHRPRRIEDAGPSGIALIAQQGDLVEIDAQIGQMRTTLPGFMMLSGSRVCLSWRMTLTPSPCSAWRKSSLP